MTAPNTLVAIRNKVRRITGRPNSTQITDAQINEYINTYYMYDLNEQLRIESFRYNYQFVTSANLPVYDFPVEAFLTAMPPVYIAGYQSYMTQSRENFFRINPGLNFFQKSIATGNGTVGPYNAQLSKTPIMPGFKPNPPGAYSSSDVADIFAALINWNVLISSTDAFGRSSSLVDDGGGTNPAGLGLLFDPNDVSTASAVARGSIDYITGQVVIGNFLTAIPVGTPINAQYIPYVASRPQSALFYQDQIILYPVPDRAYTVSFEAYKYPSQLLDDGAQPQLNEMWQLLAYGAAEKIFADNGDIENLAKFHPLLEEQLRLLQRRTIVQQTAERTATIYTEQTAFPQYPFGNLF